MSRSSASSGHATRSSWQSIRAFRARWVFPGDGSPLPHACVTIQGGTIIAVGEPPAGIMVADLGDAAIIPGLVNAHTHLEFSHLSEPVGQPGMRFADWIKTVVDERRRTMTERSDEQLAAERLMATRRGSEESQAAGVTTLGEIARPGWSPDALDDRLTTIVFLELLGLRRERIEPLMTLAREHLESAVHAFGGESAETAEFAESEPTTRNRRRIAGFSPHSPYTASPALVERVCRLSGERGVPVAMHLAESFDELELLSAHSGPLVETLEALDAWDPTAVPRGITPYDYLERLSHAARALVIHGNFLGPRDWSLLARHRERMSLVYCPRTHARFLTDRYPVAELLAAGVRVVVGTDSRATNPDLDLWSELQFVAARHPDVAPDAVLRMGTVDAAAALGMSDRGRLAPGLRPDLTIVQGAGGSVTSPWEWLWDGANRAVACD